MDTQIKKWGNSLALRIPKALAAEGHLEQGTPVEVTVENGALIVQPVTPKTRPRTRYKLEDLVARITDENRHAEVNFGPPVGKEIW